MTDCGSRLVGPVVLAYRRVPTPPGAAEDATDAPADPEADAAADVDPDAAAEPAGVVLGVGDVEPMGVLGVEQEAISGVKINKPALPAPKRNSWRRDMLWDKGFNFLSATRDSARP